MTTLLREARERSGLTQTELAERSGVAQSTISAYESGRRDPGWRVLGRLLDAAGFEATLRQRRPTPEEAGRILLLVLNLADVLPQSGRPEPLRAFRLRRG